MEADGHHVINKDTEKIIEKKKNSEQEIELGEASKQAKINKQIMETAKNDSQQMELEEVSEKEKSNKISKRPTYSAVLTSKDIRKFRDNDME
ncbi:13686_t:CDS:2 [Gigaspora rosea]|nr:13686_t:CDS:2 [Gigaspora rosea]